MRLDLKKLARTAQSEFAFLKGPKDHLYYHGRRILGRQHELASMDVVEIWYAPRGCVAV